MADFNLSFEHVLKYEGGYVDDPVDPGGETKYGISKRTYPHLDIKGLTVEQAKAIYKTDWWDKHPELEALDQALADAMFSCLINVGQQRYSRILDSATQGEQCDHSDSPLHAQDLRSDFQASAFRLEWIRFYYKLVKQRPDMRKYLVGWLARALGE